MLAPDTEAAKIKLFLGVVLALAGVGVGVAYYSSRGGDSVVVDPKPGPDPSETPVNSLDPEPQLSAPPPPLPPPPPPPPVNVEPMPPQALWVNAVNVNVRVRADPSSPSRGTLGRGTAFTANAQALGSPVKGISKTWYRGNGTDTSGGSLVGWVNADFLSREQTGPAPQPNVAPQPNYAPTPPPSPSIVSSPTIERLRIGYMRHGWYVQLGYADWFKDGEVRGLEQRIACAEAKFGTPNVVNNSQLRPPPERRRPPVGWFANFGPYDVEQDAKDRQAAVKEECDVIWDADIIAQVRD